MRPSTGKPCASAYARDVTTTAAPPSFSELALPAVTVAPSPLPNAGRSLARTSAVVSTRGPSSVSTIVSPFFPAMVTGAISFVKRPAFCASTAFRCEAAAKSSCSLRVRPAFFAVYSACPPMWTSHEAHQSPSLIMPSTIVWSPSFTPLRMPVT